MFIFNNLNERKRGYPGFSTKIKANSFRKKLA